MTDLASSPASQSFTSNPSAVVWMNRVQIWTWLTWSNSHGDSWLPPLDEEGSDD